MPHASSNELKIILHLIPGVEPGSWYTCLAQIKRTETNNLLPV